MTGGEEAFAVKPVRGRYGLWKIHETRHKRRPSRWVMPFLGLCLGIAGCAGPRPAMPPLASVKGIPGHFGRGRIIRVDTGKAVSFDRLMDELGSRDLIFIGERHDNPEHHLVEIQILQALSARYGPLNTAMEFFPRTRQQALDRYVEGVSTEAEFLKESGWKKEWGFDYTLYRPLMLFLRNGRRRVFAVNAPHAIVRKVARGGLQSLEPGERAQLAKDIDLTNQRHRDYLRDIYRAHVHKDLKRFDPFYEAQCVWEDTMAENIAGILKKDRKKMVVFTGSGHIIHKFGIPDRTIRRVPVRMATLVLYPLSGRVVIEKGLADYVWLTGDCSAMRFRNFRGHGHKPPPPTAEKAASGSGATGRADPWK